MEDGAAYSLTMSTDVVGGANIRNGREGWGENEKKRIEIRQVMGDLEVFTHLCLLKTVIQSFL